MKIQNASTKRLLLALFCAQSLVLVNCDEDDPLELDAGVDAALPDGGIPVDGASPDTAVADAPVDDSASADDAGAFDAGPTPTDAAPDSSTIFDAGLFDSGADVYEPDPGDADSDASVPSPGLFTLGGTVSGLAGSGLVIFGGPSNYTAISKDGPYKLPLKVPNGAYEVTAYSQPKNLSQTCVVANGTGIVAGANVSNLDVTCTTSTFPITVSATGVTAKGLVLKNNTNGETLAIDTSGSYTFATPVVSGGNYMVLISSQPTGGTLECNITDFSGSVTAGAPPPVKVSCVPVTPGKNAFNPPEALANTDLYAALTCTTNGTAIAQWSDLGAPCGPPPCNEVVTESTTWTATGRVRFNTATRALTFEITPDRDLLTPLQFRYLRSAYGVNVGALAQSAILCGRDVLYGLPTTDCDIRGSLSISVAYTESIDGIRFISGGGADAAIRGRVSTSGSILVSGSAYVIDVSAEGGVNGPSNIHPYYAYRSTTNRCVGVTQ